MKVSYNNQIDEIKNIINEKAKYQKVMLLYDDFVSNLEIKNIYDEIKDVCIYNQSNLRDIDNNELNNGYRVIIYLCCVDSFLKVKFSSEEFINVFCPKDAGLLPYFLNDTNTISAGDNVLIIDSTKVDVGFMSCVCFNQFFNYIKNLVSFENHQIDTSFVSQEVTQNNMFKCINNVDKSIEFVDIAILKEVDVAYEDIVLVDMLLINAFLTLITSIKNQSLSLVDVYKSARENDELIEKFHALFYNDAILNLIMLNYNLVYNFCLKTKQKILDSLNIFDLDKEKISQIVEKIKQFAKQNDGILAYLYLYGIFNV